jgi:hypothetical protein
MPSQSRKHRGAPRGLGAWTVEQRFWRSVAGTTVGGDDCWLWSGAVGANGYGVLTRDGKRVYAHRISYEINVGPIPSCAFVCHRCDVRNCVRPSHLFVGSVGDNNRDMWDKGRGRGLDPHNGKLTNEQRRDAVHRVSTGESKTSVATDLGVTRQAIGYLVRSGFYA